jgi:ABC-2 type transport system permease protein
MNAGALDAVASKTFGSSAITNSLQVAVFPGARSLKKVEPAPTGVTLTSLVDSGPNAWGETNLKDRNIAQGPTDHKGPLSLMMMAEKDKARFVVSGSALTFANVSYVNFSSGDLFLNTVNYLADEESLVSIPPKDSQPKSLTLLPEQYNLVFAVTVALIPLALLLLGAFVWWKRR